MLLTESLPLKYSTAPSNSFTRLPATPLQSLSPCLTPSLTPRAAAGLDGGLFSRPMLGGGGASAVGSHAMSGGMVRSRCFSL